MSVLDQLRRSIESIEGFGFTVTGGVGTLVLDRPEKRNALSRRMWKALPGILAAIDAAEEIDVLILTGAGGHFSAGSDIHDLNVPLADFWETNSAAEAALASVSIPTIAAIEGNCVGGGTELAAACDVRVAAPGTIYGVTAAKLGLVYPAGAHQAAGGDHRRCMGEVLPAHRRDHRLRPGRQPRLHPHRLRPPAGDGPGDRCDDRQPLAAVPDRGQANPLRRGARRL